MKVITIRNAHEREQYGKLCARISDIQKRLLCSRSYAYKVMNAHAIAYMKDPERKKRYRVMARWELEDIARTYDRKQNRGNPRFRDPDYQSELARRPRQKKRP